MSLSFPKEVTGSHYYKRFAQFLSLFRKKHIINGLFNIVVFCLIGPYQYIGE